MVCRSDNPNDNVSFGGGERENVRENLKEKNVEKQVESTEIKKKKNT